MDDRPHIDRYQQIGFPAVRLPFYIEYRLINIQSNDCDNLVDGYGC